MLYFHPWYHQCINSCYHGISNDHSQIFPYFHVWLSLSQIMMHDCSEFLSLNVRYCSYFYLFILVLVTHTFLWQLGVLLSCSLPGTGVIGSGPPILLLCQGVLSGYNYSPLCWSPGVYWVSGTVMLYLPLWYHQCK